MSNSAESFLKSITGRSHSGPLAAYLVSDQEIASIEGVQCELRTYAIASKNSGGIRDSDLAGKLAESIIDYALPPSELQRATEALIETGSSSAILALEKKAKDLFTSIETSGEGGELLLFLLAESILHYPQLLSKMVFKTNSEVHYHGADGLHASICPDSGSLIVHWCESKVYADLSAAAHKCMESIAPALLDVDKVRDRDFFLIRDNIITADGKFDDMISGFLDPDNPMFNKMLVNGLCFVGYELGEYPKLTDVPDCIGSDKFKNEVSRLQGSLEHAIQKEKLENIRIDVFALPFPDVGAFRDAFLKHVESMVV